MSWTAAYHDQQADYDDHNDHVDHEDHDDDDQIRGLLSRTGAAHPNYDHDQSWL